MTRHHSLTLVLVAAGLLAGCGTAADGGTGSGTTPSADATGSAQGPPAAESDGTGSAAATGRLPVGKETVRLDPADFTADVDNRWFPLEPGRRWTYLEHEGGHEARVVVTATSRTRRIANGVVARVVRDTVTEDGQLVEDTLDWYAQDRVGNVWYLGEQTAEFEDGKLASREGSFEAGVDGAQAGIAMPADPVPGTRYRQEYAAGEAEDNGRVLGRDLQAETPFGHFEQVFLTEDTNALEPEVTELKLYAPGVGPVLTLKVSGGAGREELIKVATVSPAAAAAAATAPLGEPYE